MMNNKKFYIYITSAAIWIGIAVLVFGSSIEKWTSFFKLTEKIVLGPSVSKYVGCTVVLMIGIELSRRTLLYYIILRKHSERRRMRKVTQWLSALISAILMLLMTSIICGIILMLILPDNIRDTYITIGMLQANIPSLSAFFLGAIAATLSFKASFKAKTGKLYRKNKNDISDSDDPYK